MLNWNELRGEVSGKLLMALLLVGISSNFALSQSLDVSEGKASANTSEFGQASEFSNVTTEFDQVEFNIQRLIREPKDKSKMRLIGQLVNRNAENRWVHLFVPFPSLVDELGNRYVIESWTGIDACRGWQEYNWQDSPTDCPGDGVSTLLGPGLPVTVSLTFAPEEEGPFDDDLASLATYLNATLSFIVAPADFTYMSYQDKKNNAVPYSVVVPQIPIPARN